MSAGTTAPTRRLVLAVLLGTVLLVVAAGCGHAAFTTGVPDVAAVVEQADAVILAEGAGENLYPGGIDGRWYVIGRDRGVTEGDTVMVRVLRFDDQRARDRAFRDVRHRMRRLPDTVVMTWGDAVVEVARIGDRRLMADLVHRLEDAGAR